MGSTRHLRLVSLPLNDKNRAVSSYNSIGARAHWAYQCLPRDARGRPPPVSIVEQRAGVSNGRLHKILNGETLKPTADTMYALAPALGVVFEWLYRGIGEGPKASYPVPPWDPQMYRDGKPRPKRRKVVKLPSRAPGQR